MSKKRLRMIVGCTIGAFGAFAVGHWPQQAVPLQMMIYTSMVVLPLIFLAFGRIEPHGRFLLGVLSILVLHSVVLLLIRTVFPFKSILTIIPIALGECTVLAALMLKILGDDEAVRTA
jgi:hypothetical protein